MKVAVVLLYGAYTPKRDDYRNYLDFIAEQIDKEGFDKVILCGGFTNPKTPEISEASSARDYLLTKFNFDGYILEDRSINTNQNLEFAVKHLDNFSTEKFFVYCDLARKAKVIWISLHYFLNLKPEKIYKLLLDYISQRNIYKDFIFGSLTVRGFDFDKSKEETIGLSYTSILDVMAIYNEEMSRMDLEQRRKDFGI